jgi:hypothetical protein
MLTTATTAKNRVSAQRKEATAAGTDAGTAAVL